MGKKNKNNGTKRQNGLTSDKVQTLRRAMRDAAKIHGEEKVASQLGHPDMESALASITVDMLKADFGSATNAVKKLTPRQPKVNKYADQIGRTKQQANNLS